MNFETFWEILLDAIKDSLIVFPFLILTYIIIEYIERKSNLFKNGNGFRGKNAPLFGALAGIFPQCGVSVMSAKLYDKDMIKAGTLLSVFIATSDEAFAILLTSGNFLSLILLIVSKFIVAVVVGYAVNAFIKKAVVIKYRLVSFKHEEYCRQCGNSTMAKTKFEAYFLYPLIHALKTLAFIFIVNLVFGIIIFFVGEQNIVAFMENKEILQPFLAGLVGLIPNCASSILITQLFVKGGISFGSMFAGLSVNAGVGLAIMLKNKTKLTKNLLLIALLYVISVSVGLIFNLIF